MSVGLYQSEPSVAGGPVVCLYVRVYTRCHIIDIALYFRLIFTLVSTATLLLGSTKIGQLLWTYVDQEEEQLVLRSRDVDKRSWVNVAQQGLIKTTITGAENGQRDIGPH